MSYYTSQAAMIFTNPFTQKIGRIDIDILESIGIDETVTITSNPIEGSFTTDNARDEPTEISISGRISAFSIRNTVVSQISALAKNSFPNRLKEAHDELYRIKNEKEPITLVTKYRSYSNMLIGKLNIPRDAGDGEEFKFSVSFQEIKIAESQLVSVENSKIKTDNAKKQSSFGRQTGATKTASPPANLKPSNITFMQFIDTLWP